MRDDRFVKQMKEANLKVFQFRSEMEELNRLQKESNAMVKLLKQLEKEESDIALQNEILAREALQNGYSPNWDDTQEGPVIKKRKQSGKQTGS